MEAIKLFRSKFASFCGNIIAWVKSKFNKIKSSKAAKIIVGGTAIVGTVFATYFGFKYFKLKTYTNNVMHCLRDTQQALYVVSAQAEQLTLDNTVLAEFLGMTLGIPAKIYD